MKISTKLALLAALISIVTYGAFTAIDSDGLPAWWLYHGITAVTRTLRSLEDALTPAPFRVLEISRGPMKMQMLHVAVAFNVADLVHKEPLDIITLASKAQVKDADALNRVLNALVSLGYFAKDSKDRFINNDASEYLRSDHPMSLVSVVKHMADESYNAYEKAIESIKTGQNAFELRYGAKIFDFYKSSPEHKANFAKTMSSFGVVVNKAISAEYDFSQYKTIADIGGSEGSLVRTILKKYPSIEKAYIFDLPEVIEEARKSLESEDPEISKKIELVSGDFFKDIPIKADAYLMRFILHDWADRDCLKILENIFKKSIPGNTTVLLFEQLLGETPSTYLADLQMLFVASGGRERTYPHFKKLLRSGGFKIYDVVHTRTPISIIEARATKSLVQYIDQDLVLNMDLDR